MFSKNVSAVAICNIPLCYFIRQQVDVQVDTNVRVNNEQRKYIYTPFFYRSRKVKEPAFQEGEGVWKEKEAINTSVVFTMFYFYLSFWCHLIKQH